MSRKKQYFFFSLFGLIVLVVVLSMGFSSWKLFGLATSQKIDGSINITSPQRSVVGAPQTATLTIHGDNRHTFTIPYIQTSPHLTVTAAASGQVIPVGGGVRFVLRNGTRLIGSSDDQQSPYTATFSHLTKGEYSLDVYVIDRTGHIQPGVNQHDEATHIGIGDIISAVGDSITECYNGWHTDKAITNWLQAPANQRSQDNRNFPQYGPTTDGQFGKPNWCAGFEVALAKRLEDSYHYPVFILNEGFAGITAQGTLHRMKQPAWIARQTALKPNKMILHLGVNDANQHVSNARYQHDMQTIISTFKSTYHVPPSNMWLADPSYDRTVPQTHDYLPVIQQLRQQNHLAGGPDFYAFYKVNTQTWYGNNNVHPNQAGMDQMARLWAEAMTSQTKLTTTSATKSFTSISGRAMLNRA